MKRMLHGLEVRCSTTVQWSPRVPVNMLFWHDILSPLPTPSLISISFFLSLFFLHSYSSFLALLPCSTSHLLPTSFLFAKPTWERYLRYFFIKHNENKVNIVFTWTYSIPTLLVLGYFSPVVWLVHSVQFCWCWDRLLLRGGHHRERGWLHALLGPHHWSVPLVLPIRSSANSPMNMCSHSHAF